jgi:hypothetical protein
MDAAICDGESVGSDEENGWSPVVVQAGDPVSTGVVPVTVGLNGVTAIWERGSTPMPEKDSPAVLRKSFCLRRRLTKAIVPARRINAATPPTIPPAIAPVCDVAFDDGDDDDDDDVALTVIWTTGALRK